MDVTHLQASIQLEDGPEVHFLITSDGTISCWGGSDEVLGAIVDLTEDIRHALFQHMHLSVDDDD